MRRTVERLVRLFSHLTERTSLKSHGIARKNALGSDGDMVCVISAWPSGLIKPMRLTPPASFVIKSSGDHVIRSRDQSIVTGWYRGWVIERMKVALLRVADIIVI